MLAAQVESRTRSERDYGIAGYAGAGEAPIPPTVVLESDVIDSLTAWLTHHEAQAIAENFYEIGQVAFRHGVPLQSLIKVIGQWTEQAVMSKSPTQPYRKAFTRNRKDREIEDAAAEFMALIRHYLIRGYQDAVR